MVPDNKLTDQHTDVSVESFSEHETTLSASS